MKGLVELRLNECAAIYGGKRDENVAKIIGFVAQCVGALSKMVYLAMKITLPRRQDAALTRV